MDFILLVEIILADFFFVLVSFYDRFSCLCPYLFTCLLDNTHFGRLFQMRNKPKLKESVKGDRKTRNGNEINRKFDQI